MELYDRMVKSSGFPDNPTAITSALNSAINACDIAGRYLHGVVRDIINSKRLPIYRGNPFPIPSPPISHTYLIFPRFKS